MKDRYPYINRITYYLENRSTNKKQTGIKLRYLNSKPRQYVVTHMYDGEIIIRPLSKQRYIVTTDSDGFIPLKEIVKDELYRVKHSEDGTIKLIPARKDGAVKNLEEAEIEVADLGKNPICDFQTYRFAVNHGAINGWDGTWNALPKSEVSYPELKDKQQKTAKNKKPFELELLENRKPDDDGWN